MAPEADQHHDSYLMAVAGRSMRGFRATTLPSLATNGIELQRLHVQHTQPYV
jgi:hypothetical protein